MGVIHRDIKPSNIMVAGGEWRVGRDEGSGFRVQGSEARESSPLSPSPSHPFTPSPRHPSSLAPHLWITDFGLAMTQKDPALTLTGDILGTLRYMSPEQAAGKSRVLDHHTDIYSLGLTLYELLTLHPAFAGDDREHLVRQVLETDPPPPHQHNPSIPRDLETIVLKATAKEPSARYATAQQMADDLRRYLGDQPIRARRPSLVERAAKWSRRHKPVVWSAAATVVAVMALLVAATVVALSQSELAGRRLRVQQGINDALAEVTRLRGQAQSAALGDQTALAQAREQLQRAVALAETGPAAPEVVAQVQGLLTELDQEQRDRQLLAALDAAWLAKANSPIWTGRDFVLKETKTVLRDAFEAYGLPVGKGPPGEAAAAIRKRPEAVRQALLAALDESRALASPRTGVLWRTDSEGGTFVHWVERDSPAGRDGRLKPGDRVVGIGRNRDAAIVDTHKMNWQEVAKILRRVSGTILRLQVVPKDATVSRLYEIHIEPDPTMAWVRAAANAADTDPWRRRVREAFDLADGANERGALQKLADDADVGGQPVRTLTRLADEMAELEAVDRAIDLLRKVRQRHPSDLVANMSLADMLANKGKPPQLEEAARYYTAAIALRPDSPGLRVDLGRVFVKLGRLDEAITEYREVIRIMPYRSEAHSNLGNALRRHGKLDEAVAECREAVRLLPTEGVYHFNLGLALEAAGKVDEALREFRGPIRLRPDHPAPHNYLAWLLATAADPKLRQPAEAVELAKKAVALAPKDGSYWNTLGVAQYRAGDHKAVIESLGKSMELSSGGNATDWFFLAMAHWQLGHKDEARTWYDKAVQWMEKNKPKDEQLLRFRAEAAELLGK